MTMSRRLASYSASSSSLAVAAPDCGIKLSSNDYVAFIRAITDAASVRPRFGRHPRLHIWGPLEARLQQADLTILGGLNEGGWPPLADPGPWLNRRCVRRLI